MIEDGCCDQHVPKEDPAKSLLTGKAGDIAKRRRGRPRVIASLEALHWV